MARKKDTMAHYNKNESLFEINKNLLQGLKARGLNCNPDTYVEESLRALKTLEQIEDVTREYLNSDDFKKLSTDNVTNYSYDKNITIEGIREIERARFKDVFWYHNNLFRYCLENSNSAFNKLESYTKDQGVSQISFAIRWAPFMTPGGLKSYITIYDDEIRSVYKGYDEYIKRIEKLLAEINVPVFGILGQEFPLLLEDEAKKSVKNFSETFAAYQYSIDIQSYLKFLRYTNLFIGINYGPQGALYSNYLEVKAIKYGWKYFSSALQDEKCFNNFLISKKFFNPLNKLFNIYSVHKFVEKSIESLKETFVTAQVIQGTCVLERNTIDTYSFLDQTNVSDKPIEITDSFKFWSPALSPDKPHIIIKNTLTSNFITYQYKFIDKKSEIKLIQENNTELSNAITKAIKLGMF